MEVSAQMFATILLVAICVFVSQDTHSQWKIVQLA